MVLPLFAGAWRERLPLPADGLFRLPEGSVEQFSMLGSNPPTAGLILSEYADLRPGDWIVQNAANSGVGRSLIALAKARGFRTINFVRDESVFAEPTAAGADIVRLDGATAVQEVRTAIGDARVGLAVDSVGGDAPARLLDLLSEGGALVSYASATGQPMSVDALTLVGKRATVHGFFADHFDYATRVLPVIREATPLIASGALFVPLGAVFDLDDIHTVIEQVVRGGRPCSRWPGHDDLRRNSHRRGSRADASRAVTRRSKRHQGHSAGDDDNLAPGLTCRNSPDHRVHADSARHGFPPCGM